MKEKIKSMSDGDLIDAMKTKMNSGEYLMELVSRHSGIYLTMVNNYTPPEKSNQKSHKSELISDKDYYIYQAALKYDEGRKTKFSTYLGNETRWMCLNLYNKEKKRRITDMDFNGSNIKELPSDDNSEKKILRNDFLNKVISIIEKDPDSRIAKIFSMRYLEGDNNKVMPWKNIGDNLKLSIQGCINIHDKAINKIKKELSKDI
jgi:DNA-directed RNA polymerase specialized sigma24 family protein